MRKGRAVSERTISRSTTQRLTVTRAWPVKKAAAPSRPYSGPSGAATRPVARSVCAKRRPMQLPMRSVGEKVPAGMARPLVHAAAA